jgi:hypothetical protein
LAAAVLGRDDIFPIAAQVLKLPLSILIGAIESDVSDSLTLHSH